MLELRPKTILLTTDFSANAAEAIPYAHALADRYEATLVVVHVVTEHLEHLYAEVTSPTVDARTAAAVHDAEVKLRRIDFGTDPERTRREVVCASTASTGILSAINTYKPDLVIISTHGRALLGRLLFGSVTSEIVSHAACPVLCVKSREHGMLNIDGRLRVEKLLTAADTSLPDDPAFRMSLGLAKQWGAELHVMDIRHPHLSPFFFPEGFVTFVEDLEARGAAEKQLGAWLVEAKQQGVKTHVANDDVVHAGNLSRYAASHDIDCIVARRRLPGRLPFSTAGGPENLLHDTRCPLLIV